jgi:hypothetical protein
MYVRRSVWMAIHQLEKLSSRSIKWDRVRRWLEAIESIFALVVRHKLPAQVVIYLVLILLFVEA